MLQLLFFILLFTFSYSQEYQPKTPKDMDDYIVKISDDYIAIASKWTQCLSQKKYDSLKVYSSKMTQYTEWAVKELGKVRDIGGSEDYRSEQIRMYMYEKALISKTYARFDKFTIKTSKKERSAALDNMLKYAPEEKTRSAKLDEARRIYCVKNKLQCVER